MTTFVLVHGAFCGAWIWKKVIPLLRGAGHDVHAVTLTGLGERSHLLTPDVGLDTHCRDIASVILFEDLSRVVLVGHSYGGSVITGAAGLASDRIAHLVYLDAAYPDFRPPRSERPANAVFRRESPTQLATPPPSVLAPEWGVTDPKDSKWVLSKLTAHPVRASDDPFQPDLGMIAGSPRTCISCTVNQRATMAATAARIRADKAWRYREMPTGHFPMITMPRETAALLMETV